MACDKPSTGTRGTQIGSRLSAEASYRSYYEKYYENRDSTLHAIAQSGPKSLD